MGCTTAENPVVYTQFVANVLFFFFRDGMVIDSGGHRIKLYSDVLNILMSLQSREIKIAAASRLIIIMIIIIIIIIIIRVFIKYPKQTFEYKNKRIKTSKPW